MKFRFTSLLSIVAICANVSAKLTSNEKNLLVKLHNEARRDVGVGMQDVHWDSGLAEAAEVNVYITIL